MRLLEYRRKTLEELFSEYAKKENQSLVVNEVYARIKDTFEMLDRFPSEVAQHYRLFVDPESNSKRPAAEIFGVTLSCDAHELKQELEAETMKGNHLLSCLNFITTHRGPGPSPSICNQDNPSQTCPQANLIKTIFN